MDVPTNRKALYPAPECHICKMPIYTDKQGFSYHGSMEHGNCWRHYPECPETTPTKEATK